MVRIRIWTWMLRLGLVLAGVHYLKIVFGETGGVWEAKRIVMLAAGILLPALAVFLPMLAKRPPDPGRLESFSKYFLQAAAWCMLAVALIELTLRGLVNNPPLDKDVTNWSGDIPGLNSTVLWGKEGYGLTRYKRWGEIQTPISDRNRDNDLMVLGDSHTEALQVGDDFKFVSVAETVLRGRGHDYDLHNLGRSGLAMADYVSWIPPYKEIFRPKAIAVQLQLGDFVESFDEGQFNKFAFNDDGGLDLLRVFDFSPEFDQRQRRQHYIYSQILFLGRERWNAMWKPTGGGLEETAAQDDPGRGVGSNPDSAVDPGAFDSNLAVKQMDLLLEASGDVPLIVVLLPNTPRISGENIVLEDPNHALLKEFLAQYYPNVVTVDPLPEFQRLTREGYLPRGFFNSLPGEGHLNIQGHRIVGELLANAFEQVLR